MKLAEALQERADLNRTIEQLKYRLCNNVLVQEGEEAVEEPQALKQKLDGCLERLEHLIACINHTNGNTVVDGQTLTQLIAKKDVLTLKIGTYRDVLAEASQTAGRARGTEIRIKAAISVPEWQAEADSLSRELRRLDNRLQETNWTTELQE